MNKLDGTGIQHIGKLDDFQIESILTKVVPLIAAPEDHEFFRAILRLTAEESTACSFYGVVSRLLEAEVTK